MRTPHPGLPPQGGKEAKPAPAYLPLEGGGRCGTHRVGVIAARRPFDVPRPDRGASSKMNLSFRGRACAEPGTSGNAQ